MSTNISDKSGITSSILDTFANASPEERRGHCTNELMALFAHDFAEMQWRCAGYFRNFATPTALPTTSWHVDNADKLLMSSIFLIVGIVGFLGNLMTVAVIYRTPRLQSYTNYFLASLAMSDMLLIMVGVPFDLISLWRDNLAPAIYGYCETTSTAISWFTFASILLIVALTAERFVAICYPFSLKSYFTKKTVGWVVSGIWILSFCSSLYIGLQFTQVATDLCGNVLPVGVGHGSCNFVGWSDFDYAFEFMLCLTFISPLLFIIYCYFRILNTLNAVSLNQTLHMPLGNQSSDSSVIAKSPRGSGPAKEFGGHRLHVHQRLSGGTLMSKKAQKVVIKMLVTVSIVFFACYLPYHVERLIVRYYGESCKQSSLCLLLYPITGLLQYVSATLNPIIYNLMSVKFRTAFRALLRRIFAPMRSGHTTATDMPTTPLQL
uniref:G_PROTEIN_RECEP_F1_2 domain-containing protein n=1 Tax=Panagrellus redivivus TaxID=6233 RepID=A0A7E4VHL3_PANRE